MYNILLYETPNWITLSAFIFALLKSINTDYHLFIYTLS